MPSLGVRELLVIHLLFSGSPTIRKLETASVRQIVSTATQVRWVDPGERGSFFAEAVKKGQRIVTGLRMRYSGADGGLDLDSAHMAPIYRTLVFRI